MSDQIAVNNATGIPMHWVDNGDGTFSPKISISGGTTAPPAVRAGISAPANSVGGASATIIAAGTFLDSVTIQNTHATQTLYVSFNTPALTTDFAIGPAGAALTLPFGPTNALYGIGSGAATTFAVIGA